MAKNLLSKLKHKIKQTGVKKKEEFNHLNYMNWTDKN